VSATAPKLQTGLFRFCSRCPHLRQAYKMMATTDGWLRNVNAAARKPNEDAAIMLRA
jgi:hypothetical protein